MIRKLPIVPTVFVLAAVATMIALGVWQLQRMAWKETLLATYAQAGQIADPVPYPYDDDPQAALYRQSQVTCDEVLGQGAISGRSASGEAGWAQTAQCRTVGGDAEVTLGWSRNPAPHSWAGGSVTGTIAPYGEGVRLVASPPLAGLEPMAAPDPSEIPNNHFAYAMQWFFFAATALVIYGLALRRRLARGGEQG